MKPPISEPVFIPEKELFEIEEEIGPEITSKHCFSTQREANDFLIDYNLCGQPSYHSDIKSKIEVSEDRDGFNSLTTLRKDDEGKISISFAKIPYSLEYEKIQDITFYGDAARKVCAQLPKAWKQSD